MSEEIKAPAEYKDPTYFDRKDPNELVRRVGWGFIILGQLCRNFKTSGGEFIFPQFVRHHLSNIFDGAVLATYADEAQILFTEKILKKKSQHRPVLCAAFALATCTAWEAKESTFPNRHFDYKDEACHVISTAGYLAFVSKRRKQKASSEKEPKPD